MADSDSVKHETSTTQECAGQWTWTCSCGAEGTRIADRPNAEWRARLHRQRKGGE